MANRLRWSIVFLVVVALSASIQPSAADSSIANSQRLLDLLGYSPGEADGILGPNTRRAIVRFQNDHGLRTDGTVTEELTTALANQVNVELQAAAQNWSRWNSEQRLTFLDAVTNDFLRRNGYRSVRVESAAIPLDENGNAAMALYDPSTKTIKYNLEGPGRYLLDYFFNSMEAVYHEATHAMNDQSGGPELWTDEWYDTDEAISWDFGDLAARSMLAKAIDEAIRSLETRTPTVDAVSTSKGNHYLGSTSFTLEFEQSSNCSGSLKGALQGEILNDGTIRGAGVVNVDGHSVKLTINGRRTENRVRIRASWYYSDGVVRLDVSDISMPFEDGAEWSITHDEWQRLAIEQDVREHDELSAEESRSIRQHLIDVCDGATTWRIRFRPKLRRIIVRNASQQGVLGPENWAAVRKQDEYVIVEAITEPASPDVWKKLNWSGDDLLAVSGQPNLRRISRSTAARYRVEASLANDTKAVTIWILWAEVDSRTEKYQRTPKNSAQYRDLGVQYNSGIDDTEQLGVQVYDEGSRAVGKTAHIAQLEPAGVHKVVQCCWEFKREKRGTRWTGRIRQPRWDEWTDDTSQAAALRLIPDDEDRLYDIDAPTIGGASYEETNEAYINFRQFVVWNGERCSEFAHWYFKGMWSNDSLPPVIASSVGKETILIPQESYFKQ